MPDSRPTWPGLAIRGSRAFITEPLSSAETPATTRQIRIGKMRLGSPGVASHRALLASTNGIARPTSQARGLRRASTLAPTSGLNTAIIRPETAPA